MGKQKERSNLPKKKKVRGLKGMAAIDDELSKIVGLDGLKRQLRRFATGILMDKRRRKTGMKPCPRKPPHMVFLGNPGTGKTTIARIMGKLLHSAGLLKRHDVTEVQRTDLVAKYMGQTGIKTKKKIDEAMGGVLFVDEAYRLVQGSHWDYGEEALDEIMSVLDDGNVSVIFAGYPEPMKRVLSSNQGFRRRVKHIFEFPDYTSGDLAEMLMIKMTTEGKDENSRFYGFKLHPSCTYENVVKLIDDHTSAKLRSIMNGGLVDDLLDNARENLDSRLSSVPPEDVEDDDLLWTITLDDLEVGLDQLSNRESGI